MSLLDRGPHVVRVTPMRPTPSSLGTRYVAGEPVLVRNIAIQAVMTRRTDATDEIETIGTQAEVAYRIIGRGNWPGGPMSRVEVLVGPVPGIFDQRGEPGYSNMSHRTAHYDVVITARGVEAK